ncbi:MAG: tetratricopeptide repeat protein, partial [Fibrobacter sp.]|nr:tetratricopeptide repeat protein [Fibrobacter sp.]
SDTSSIAAKAFYQLGLIYQKKFKNYDKAETMFTMASNMRDSACAENAGIRLSAMEKLRLLRDEKNDSLKTETDFKIGEVFLFELDEPDSAYNQFMALIIDESEEKDSIYIPKALCMAAIIARDGLKDSARADSIFNVVIDSYPSSEFAKKAQEEMDVAVTIKTVRDSAIEAYRDAEKLLYYDNADVKAAVQAFYDVYRKYPDMDIAPKSLFAAAWAADVILQKNVTAKSLYERICENYPESQYCTQEARPRLKIVMDTLGALEKNQEKKKNVKKTEKKSIEKQINPEDTAGVENGEIKQESLQAEEIDDDSLIPESDY